MSAITKTQVMLNYTSAAGASASVTFDLVESESWQGGAVPTKYPVERTTDVTDNVRPLPDKVSLKVFVTNEPARATMWTQVATVPLTIQPPTPDVDQPTTIVQWDDWDNMLAARALGATAAGLIGGLAGPAGGAVGAIGGAAALGALLPPVAVPQSLDVNGGIPRQAPYAPVTVQATQVITQGDYVRQTVALLDKLKSAAQLFEVVGSKKTVENMVITRIGQVRDASTGTGAEFDLELEQIVMVDTTTVPAPVATLPRVQAPVSKGVQSTTPAPKAASILFDAVH